jgi:CDP-diacylglycerol--serine O-phosphatidyltransferase
MAFPPTGRWRFIVPNAVTCTSLALGLVSIMQSFAGQYESAAWFILMCVLLDKLDGTVARALNASTKIGVQLDSFSDLVTFGIAPGFLYLGLTTRDPRYATFWAGETMQLLTTIACLFLGVMAALRLAKFNVMTEEVGSKIFLGVPTTLVGGLSASFYLTAEKYAFPPVLVAMVPVMLVLFGLWMVSNIPLPKMRATSSKAYNIFMVGNALASYVLIAFRIIPEIPFLQSFLYLVIGTGYALAYMKDEWQPFTRAGREAA